MVTINALLATAAWIEGLYVATLDQTGSAQKGGAVVGHLLLSRRPIEAPNRINLGNADVILGFDLLGVANPEHLKFASPERTTALLNTNLTPTIDVIRSRAALVGPEHMLEQINSVTRRGRNIIVDGNRLAEGLFGSHMAVNLFLLGVAYQGGLIPLSLQSIEQAIRLNEVDVEKNLQVFEWGRKYYHDAKSVEEILTEFGPKPARALDRVAELHRLSRCGLRAAVLRFRGCGDSPRACFSGYRGALSVQADGVQGRVRSRTPADQASIRAADSGHLAEGRVRFLTIYILRFCAVSDSRRN